VQFSLIIRSFIIACMFLPHALADQIILANGDVLQGKVKAQSESHIIWLSDSFGDLTIELNQVRAIEIQEVADTDPNIVSNQLPVKIKDEKQTLQGSVGLSGSFRSGNQDREEWAINVDLSKRHETIRQRAGLDYQLRREENDVSKQNYDITYAIDWFFKDEWFLSNNLSFGANDDRALDQFYSVSTLLGNQLWDTKTGALSLEGGVTWINEELLSDVVEQRLTWNWSTNYRKRLFNNVDFSHRNQLLVAIDDSRNSQFNADIGLDFPLIDDLFTKISFMWNYDNQPAQGIEKIDRRLNIGLNFVW
jgi:putative salt-induced outer membrane protein YdiY